MRDKTSRKDTSASRGSLGDGVGGATKRGGEQVKERDTRAR